MTGAPRFEYVDAVTSDLTFVAKGESLEDVFASAAEALLSATIESLDTVQPRSVRTLELLDRHPDLLLLRFLNELIYLRDADGLLLLVRRVEFELGEELRLRAELTGEPYDPERHAPVGEPKAATPHGLALLHGPEGWTATVTIDV